MDVSDKLPAILEHIQVKDKETFLNDIFKNDNELRLVNDFEDYKSQRKKGLTYQKGFSASLSRLIEFKNTTNEELREFLGYSRNRLSDIRQGHVEAKREEIAEICLALELGPLTIFKLYSVSGLIFNTEINEIDRALHYAIQLPRENDKKVRLKLFRDYITKS